MARNDTEVFCALALNTLLFSYIVTILQYRDDTRESRHSGEYFLHAVLFIMRSRGVDSEQKFRVVEQTVFRSASR